MDEVECIAQELQDWEGFVPFYFPGQAQGYPEATLRLSSLLIAKRLGPKAAWGAYSRLP
jgi:hypothetical protein